MIGLFERLLHGNTILAVSGRMPRCAGYAGELEAASSNSVSVKIFKLEEAAALLPVIRPLLVKLTTRRRDVAIALLEADVARGFGTESNSGHDPLLLRRDARELQDELLALIETIQSHGCVVKDLDLGLVDFPALRGGELVNLCWKMNETTIGFWHSVDEGFASRKPLSRKRAT